MNDPWIELDRAHVWHPYTQMQTAPPAIPVARGEGVYLVTPDGRRILDGISSWWVNIHGHNHPRLNRALAQQAGQLAQVIFAGFTHEPGAALAAELVRRVPPGLPRVFYSDDGSTAVEVALKMAWQYWRNRGEARRRLFVALEGGYHGDTFGAMAASGSDTFKRHFQDLLFEVRFAHAHDGAGRAIGTLRSACRGDGCGISLDDILSREGDRVAAVIVEPILQGAGGMHIWPPAYLRHVRELTSRAGIPLIADEVLTGFGRTGRMFACEHAGIAPDIICLSKALTGGYLPFGATLCTDAIYQAFLGEAGDRTLLHGHSYTGNALACAVALESLRLFEEENRLARVETIESLFRERLAGFSGLPRVRETRGIGGVAVIELEGSGYFDDLGSLLRQKFLERDLLLRPLGNTVYFMPPYVITDDEAHRVFDIIHDVIAGL